MITPARAKPHKRIPKRMFLLVLAGLLGAVGAIGGARPVRASGVPYAVGDRQRLQLGPGVHRPLVRTQFAERRPSARLDRRRGQQLGST